MQKYGVNIPGQKKYSPDYLKMANGSCEAYSYSQGLSFNSEEVTNLV